MHFKKAVSLILSIAMISTVFTGCGKDKTLDVSKNTQVEETKEEKDLTSSSEASTEDKSDKKPEEKKQSLADQIRAANNVKPEYTKEYLASILPENIQMTSLATDEVPYTMEISTIGDKKAEMVLRNSYKVSDDEKSEAQENLKEYEGKELKDIEESEKELYLDTVAKASGEYNIEFRMFMDIENDKMYSKLTLADQDLFNFEINTKKSKDEIAETPINPKDSAVTGKMIEEATDVKELEQEEIEGITYDVVEVKIADKDDAEKENKPIKLFINKDDYKLAYIGAEENLQKVIYKISEIDSIDDSWTKDSKEAQEEAFMAVLGGILMVAVAGQDVNMNSDNNASTEEGIRYELLIEGELSDPKYTLIRYEDGNLVDQLVTDSNSNIRITGYSAEETVDNSVGSSTIKGLDTVHIRFDDTDESKDMTPEEAYELLKNN